MTKLDGTARGGILVAIAASFGLPVHFIGVGEAIEDLRRSRPTISRAPSQGPHDRRICSKKPERRRTTRVNPLLKLALELGPLGALLPRQRPATAGAASRPRRAGGQLFVATALFMVATLVALGELHPDPASADDAARHRHRRHGLRRADAGLQDETFIKMKPTIINGLFGAVLLGGLAFGRRCSPMCSIRSSTSTTKAGAS